MGRVNYVSPWCFLKKNWIQVLCLLIISFGIYFQVISHDYILDDAIVLSENKFVHKGLEGIPDILKYDSFYGYFDQQIDLLEGGRYRPLSLVTFAIEYQFLGLNPAVSHIVNLLLYGLLGVLIYLLFTWFQQRFKLDGGTWINMAFIGAVLFLLHPIHTEGVINIKSRDEIMALLFALGALVFFINAVFISPRKRWLWYGLGGLSLFFGMLSKENAVTYALVIPVSLYCFMQDRDHKKLIVPTVVLLIISGIYLYLRYSVIGDTVSSSQVDNPLNNPFYSFSATEYWGTILYTFTKYIELLILPIHLSHDYYPYAIPIADFSYARVWIAIIAYSAMGLWAIYGLYRRSIPAWAAFYYLATFSVVSNVFVVIGTTMNERFIFMSSLAFSLVTAWLIFSLRKWNKYLVIVAFLALSSFYAYGTYIRCPDWSSYISLNRSAVEHAPNSARSQLFYGTALFRKAQSLPNGSEKEELFREALQHFITAQDVFHKLGTEKTKKFAYRDAINMRGGAAGELYKMGVLKTELLLYHLKEVLKKDPKNDYAMQFLQFLNRQRNPELIPFYRDLLDSVMIPYGKALGPSYFNTAIQYVNLALQLAPNDVYFLQKQAEIYTLMGRN